MPGALKTGFSMKFKFSHHYSHCKTPPSPPLIGIRIGKDKKDEKKISKLGYFMWPNFLQFSRKSA